jgi:hypothetical protein
MNSGCFHSLLQVLILGPLFAIGLTIVGGWKFLINGFWDTDWLAIPFWAGLYVMNLFLVFLIYPIPVILGSFIIRKLLDPSRKLLHFLAGLVMGLVIYGAFWGLYVHSEGYLMLGLEVYAFPELKYAPVFMLHSAMYFWLMAASDQKSKLNDL